MEALEDKIKDAIINYCNAIYENSGLIVTNITLEYINKGDMCGPEFQIAAIEIHTTKSL